MKKQVHLFLTALMFMTRIPVPLNIDHSGDALQKSVRYFSWVGIIVGAISAGVLFLAQTLFSIPLAVACSMLSSILVTGALHEDGFADCCDAFGGGWTKEKILLIMKDSRLGTFGVIGLIAVLGMKFILLQDLFKQLSIFHLSLVIIAAHSTSRFMAVTVMQQYDYVQDMAASKSKAAVSRKLTIPELLTVAGGGLIPLFFLPPIMSLVLVFVVMARWFCGRYFYKRIGGYTGDCLGATQQVCEIIFYAGVMVIIALKLPGVTWLH